MTATIPTRPPITKVANFVVKTDNLEEARRFYSPAEQSVFKVKDEQYIEVVPALQNPADEKLIQIGFATADARKLRDYLALPATTPRGVNT